MRKYLELNLSDYKPFENMTSNHISDKILTYYTEIMKEYNIDFHGRQKLSKYVISVQSINNYVILQIAFHILK